MTTDITDYERIGRIFDAQYPGRCVFDYDHRVKLRDSVSKVRLRENPFLPISGVACKACTRLLPAARG